MIEKVKIPAQGRNKAYKHLSEGVSSIKVTSETTGTGGDGATALNELSDVALSTLAAGDFLRYDGTVFINDPSEDIPRKANTETISGTWLFSAQIDFSDRIRINTALNTERLNVGGNGLFTGNVTAQGNLISQTDVTASQDIKATRDVTAGRNIISDGNVTAYGDLRAQKDTPDAATNTLDLTYAYNANAVSRNSLMVLGRASTSDHKFRTGVTSTSAYGNSPSFLIDSLSSSSWQRIFTIKDGKAGFGGTSPQRQFVVSNSDAHGIEFRANDGDGKADIFAYNRSTSSNIPLVLQASNFEFVDGYIGVGIAPLSQYRLRLSGNSIFYGNISTNEGNALFDGTLEVQSSSIFRDTIEQYAGTIGTNDFQSQLQGWRGDYAGNWDVRYLFTDELRTKAFTADITQVLAGSDFLTKSAGKLAANFIIPAIGATGQLLVEDLEGQPGIECFIDGDWIRLRVFDRTDGLEIKNVWGQVQLNTINTNNTQTYTFTTDDDGGVSGKTVFKGSIALDYGQSGDGYIEHTVLDTYSPYSQVVTWSGDNPYDSSNLELLTRWGVLDGIQNATGSGLWAANTFLTDYLLAGDLTKTDQYMEYSGGVLTVAGQITVLPGGNAETQSGAQSKADAAETAAQDYADSKDTDVINNYSLGDLASLAYLDEVEAAKLGTTVIQGGYLVTSLIEAGSITTSKLAFTPTDSTNIIGRVNASTEGLEIEATKLDLTASEFDFTSDTDFWRTTDHNFQFGGANGISYDGSEVTIGSNVIIDGADLTINSLPKITDVGLRLLARYDKSGIEATGQSPIISQSETAFDEGVAGLAADFSGGGYYQYDCAYSGDYIIFSCWFKAVKNDTIRTLISQKRTGDTLDRGILLNSSNDITMVSRSSEGAYRSTTAASNSWNSSEWTHVVGVQYYTTLEIWVNGEKQSSTEMPDVSGFDKEVDVGRRYNGSYAYDGQIDEVRIYQTLSLPSDIRSNLAKFYKTLFLFPSGNVGGTLSANLVRSGEIVSQNWDGTIGTQLDLNNGTFFAGNDTSSINWTGSALNIKGADLSVNSMVRTTDTGLRLLVKYEYSGIVNSSMSGAIVEGNSSFQADGISGACADFDSSKETDYYIYNNQYTGNYVVFSCWFKSQKDNTIKSLMSQKMQYDSLYRGIVIWSDNNIRLITRTDQSTMRYVEILASEWENDQWHHIIGYFNGNTLNVYLDGELKETSTISDNLNNYWNDTIVIGKRSNDSSYYFDGQIDEVRVYQSSFLTISVEELVKSLYLYPGGTTGGLISANQVRTGELISKNWTGPSSFAGTNFDLDNGILEMRFGGSTIFDFNSVTQTAQIAGFNFDDTKLWNDNLIIDNNRITIDNVGGIRLNQRGNVWDPGNPSISFYAHDTGNRVGALESDTHGVYLRAYWRNTDTKGSDIFLQLNDIYLEGNTVIENYNVTEYISSAQSPYVGQTNDPNLVAYRNCFILDVDINLADMTDTPPNGHLVYFLAPLGDGNKTIYNYNDAGWDSTIADGYYIGFMYWNGNWHRQRT